ncbi:MAG: mannose-1-phosphate guanylyltransferase/mannose-6-phosphate isomerase [Terricaulis sp.]
MTYRIIPAIMSGGAGTRLWPLSTDAQPKQFHALGGSHSLFAETVRRVQGDHGALSFAPPVVICNEKHRTPVESDLAEIGVRPAAIVLEPAPKNTAAVAAVAAAVGAELDPDALVLLLPADHLVGDRDAFLAAIERAAPVARERIVTFGITPDRPATEYGYIKRGAQLREGVFAVESFREKPNAPTAREYLSTSGYSWNAGMFFFSPRVMLEEFDATPLIRDAALAALKDATRDGVDIRLDPEAFAKSPSHPLDIAVMEKTDRAAVAPCEIGWADVGSWDEIWRLSERDAAGNVLQGSAVALDGANNLLHGAGVKVCVAGVSDLVVVATPDAVLIVPRERAQDVKALRELALKMR